MSRAADRAQAVLERRPLVDGHNDVLYRMRRRNFYDFDDCDLARAQPDLMTDIPRLRAGGVGGQFWSVYVPSHLQGDAAVTATLEQIEAAHAMIARYPNTFRLARGADEVDVAVSDGYIASLLGMEGGHSIGSSMATLRTMYDLGVRYLTLTHNENTPWADAATDAAAHGGLSRFGEAVVAEMNRLGMLVDCSHVSAATMADVLRVSAAPPVFSHSSCRALCSHPRNVPDDILARLASVGGVVMVTFVPQFVSQEYADWHAACREEVTRNGGDPDDPADWSATAAAFVRAHPRPKVTVAQVADHVDHAREIAGVAQIGIGGDYDGTEHQPEGLEDVSTYPALFAELARRGYRDDDLAGIACGNVLRLLRTAEGVATRLRSEREPSRARIHDLDGDGAAAA